MASTMDLPLSGESQPSESSAAESDVTASSSMDTRGPVAPEPEGSSSRRDNGDRKRNPRQPSQLQRQIERQRNMSRKMAPITSPPSSSVRMMPMNRMVVPSERNGDYRQDTQALVGWDSGDSMDEFDLSASRSKRVQNDVQQQLLKDGYRLDEVSDDDDLDLIPPRAQPAGWIPCQPTMCSESCSIM
ncbi:protein FAM219A-like [Sycon ciliatum]|uniref:protein FAM219A-like n=1 Tax=Sycon ciliatum TaxID=27933 RepID=UPI0031F6A7DB